MAPGANLDDELNPEQAEAVAYRGGPLLVLAGPGSGKTRVVAARIARLIAGGAAPGSVVALTFTNQAAREMRARVATLLGRDPAATFLGTFHAWGLRFLRGHGRDLGVPRDFVVLDRSEQSRIVNGCLEALGIDEGRLPVRRAVDLVSRSRSGLAAAAPAEHVVELVRRYEQALAENNGLDFDDLLIRPLAILRHRKELVDRVRPEHIIVDEFQDTSPAQAELLEVLWPATGEVAVVGDEDQAIYGFRGAVVRHILEFPERHPGTRIVRLVRNYRSTAHILGAASTLVANNRERLGKSLVAARTGGGLVGVVGMPSPEAEAEEVARLCVERLARRPGRSLAVLYRTNAQSRLVEEAMSRRRVAYEVVKGQRFFERREVKDVLAYARLAAGPDDRVAFERIVNVPARGVGPAVLDAVAACATSAGLSPLQAARALVVEGAPEGRRLAPFLALLDRLVGRLGALAPGAFLRELVAETGYARLLDKEEDEPAGGGRRKDNVEELFRKAEEGSRGCGRESLLEFLDEVAVTNEPDRTGRGSVSLMTLHNAKGLEFDAVIVCGVEEGLLPIAPFDATASADVEEERRLLHVGMTRAKDELVLTYALGRRPWREGAAASVASRFIAELPRPHVRLEGLAGLPQAAPPSSSVPRAVAPVGNRPERAERGATGRGGTSAPERRDVPFALGSWVRHASYGEGMIVEREGSGDGLKLGVRFTSGLRKKLVAKFAALVAITRVMPR